MKRKLLAWVMTLAMLCSLLPSVGLSALAAPGETEQKNVQELEEPISGESGEAVAGEKPLDEEGDYVISTAEELAAFSEEVASGALSYRNVKLAEDAKITIDPTTWKSIGTRAHPYMGNFDGNGATITFASKDEGAVAGKNCVGLFGYVVSGSVKNLTVKGTLTVDNTDNKVSKDYVDNGYLYVGGVAAYAGNCVRNDTRYSVYGDTTFENCHVDGLNLNVVSEVYVEVGGVVGCVITEQVGNNGATTSVKDCTVSGTVSAKSTDENAYVGGVLGYAYTFSHSNDKGSNIGAYNLVENCKVDATVKGDSVIYYAYVGGIVGYAYSYTQSESGTSFFTQISDCTVTGTVTGVSEKGYYAYVGGIAGAAYYADISDCTVGEAGSETPAPATITAGAQSFIYVGGVAGSCFGYVSDCSVLANISSLNDNFGGGDAAGVAGCCYGGITNCQFDGTINLDAQGYAFGGGIVSYYSSNYFDGKGSVSNCSASGDLKVSSSNGYVYAGGVIGEDYKGDVKYCTSDIDVTVTVTGESNVYAYGGGVVGYSGDQDYCYENYETNVTNCTARGDVVVTGTYGAYAGGVIGYSGDENQDEDNYYQLNNVTNCVAYGGTITATAEYPFVGGVVGGSYGYYSETDKKFLGSICNCGYDNPDGVISAVSVDDDGDAYVGGIAGYYDSGAIQNSYAVAHQVTAQTKCGADLYIGGVVGKAYSGTITNVYSRLDEINNGYPSGSDGCYLGLYAGYLFEETILGGNNFYYPEVSGLRSHWGNSQNNEPKSVSQDVIKDASTKNKTALRNILNTWVAAQSGDDYALWKMSDGADVNSRYPVLSNHKGHVCNGVTFETEIQDETGLINLFKSGGSGYLTKDIELSKTLQVEPGKTVYLCLNGHDISYTSGTVIMVASEKGKDPTEFNLYDCAEGDDVGKITGGKGNQTQTNKLDRTYTVSSGSDFTASKIENCGGGVYVDEGSTFNMYGGLITGNSADYGGGVFVGVGCYPQDEHTTTGSEIGSCSYNCHVGVFNMYGGEISGNTASKIGGGVYVARYDSYCELEWNEDTHKCHGTWSGNAKIQVFGDASIIWNTNSVSKQKENLYLTSGACVVVGEDLKDASIGVTLADGTGQVSSGSVSLDAGNCFSADKADKEAVLDHYQKVCLEQTKTSLTHTHKDVYGEEEILFNETASGTMANDYASGTNNVCLTGDVILQEDIVINGTLNLCLSGYAMNLNGHHIINNGTINLFDCPNGRVNYFDEGENGLWVWSDNQEGPETDTHHAVTNGCIYGGSDVNSAQKGGGAIYNGENYCELNIFGGAFVGCYSDTQGGAICNEDGSLLIRDAEFAGNVAKGDGGAVFNAATGQNFGSHDGLSYQLDDFEFFPNVWVSLYNVKIHDNTAKNGGGLCNTTWKNTASQLALYEGTVIENNTATENGGGIFNGASRLWFGESTVENDSLQIKGNYAGKDGGGIYNTGEFYGEDETNVATLISENEAVGNGGGICNVHSDNSGSDPKIRMEGVQIEKNEANNGGGIYSKGYEVILGRFAWITENKAIANADQGGNGGGIYVSDGQLQLAGVKTTTTKIKGISITGNEAVNGAGVYAVNGERDFEKTGLYFSGSLNFLSNEAYGNGGGLFIGDGVEAYFSDYNTQGFDLDATFAENSAANGGAIYTKATLALKNSSSSENGTITLTANSAEKGGAIYNDEAELTVGVCTTIGGDEEGDANTALNGGGLYNNNGSVTIDGASILGNGAIYYTNSEGIPANGIPGGGGIYNYDGTVTMNDSANVTGNTSEGLGGGIYSVEADNAEGTDTLVDIYAEVSVKGNKADSNGGGIYNQDGIVKVRGTVESNEAVGNGGGIFSHGGTIGLTGSILDNTAENGGGIYAESVTLTTNSAIVNANTANVDGAGLYLDADSTATLKGNTHIGGDPKSDDSEANDSEANDSGADQMWNTAKGNGGGIYNAGTLNIGTAKDEEDAEISVICNKANGNGGGIYNVGTLKVVRDLIVEYNISDANGGGIYNAAAELTLSDLVSINQNEAENGGGLYNQAGTVTVSDERLAENYAEDKGGAIYNNDTLTLSQVGLAKNYAQYGAGIYNAKTVNDSYLNAFGNVATKDGGGIFNTGTFNIISGGAMENEAVNGAGIYNQGTMNLTVDNDTVNVEGNIASGGNGGGIFNDTNAVLTLSGTQADPAYTAISVSGNTAVDGAGIYNLGTATLESDQATNVVSGNTASGNGGGIYTADTLNLSDYVDITDNSATGNGGGIYYADGTININDVVKVTDNTNGNVYMAKDVAPMHIGDNGLNAGTKIGVSLEQKVPPTFKVADGAKDDDTASLYVSNKYIVSDKDDAAYIVNAQKTSIYIGVSDMYNIYVQGSTYGTVTVKSPYGEDMEAPEGATVALTVTPDSGYKLEKLTVVDKDGTSISVTADTFVMPAKNVYISATFTELTEEYHKITVGNPTGGSIAVTDPTDITAVAFGKTVTLSQTPNSSYTFDHWVVTYFDGTDTQTITPVNNQFRMPAYDVTVSAVYTYHGGGSGGGGGGGGGGATTYTATVASGIQNGTVSLSKTSGLTSGQSVTVTTIPDAGYVLDKVTVTNKSTGKEVTVTDNKTFNMPAANVTVTATFKAETEATSDPVDGDTTNHFTDVNSSDYFYEPVQWAVENGITSGVSATAFGPNDITTRAQMVTFLWRAAGSPEPVTTVNPFTDVNESDYFYKAVLWGYENGYVKGTSDTTFSPNLTVTRGQAVTFLARLNGVADEATGYTHPFSDVPADAYYNNSIAWASQKEIANGTGADTFAPDQGCKRGEVVTFLFRNANQ